MEGQIEDFSKILKQIKKARHEIKYNRREFWQKNRVNFRNNIRTITSFFKFPDKWTVNIIASGFLKDRHVMPYDKDVWSFSDVVGATENQGYDIVLFFNKVDMEFLSAPGLLPIVVHEVKHVFQAAADPVKYVQSGANDTLNQEYEKEAEAEIRKYSDEFRKQYALENVMFCYDEEGWKGATKIANALHGEFKNSWGGGYENDLTDEEYAAFQKALEEKDIDVFIDYFVESIEKSEPEEKKN